MQKKERRETLAIGILGAVLSFAVLYFPILVVLFPLMPLPYIYLLKRYGHRAGTLAVLLTAGITASYTGIVGLLVSLATFGLMAVAVGGAFRENLKPAWTALISVGTAVAALLVLYYMGMRFGAVESVRASLQEVMPWERLAALGFDVENKSELVDLYLAVLPGFFSGVGLLVGLVDYYIFAGVLRKLGCTVERIKPMKEWAFPKWIALIYILVEFLPKDILIVNVQFGLMAVLMLEGFVLIYYLLDRWGIHRSLRYLAMLLIVPVCFMFLYLIGIFDAFFPIRKVNRWRIGEE